MPRPWGVWDFAADYATGRTDPPPCTEAPEWASAGTDELSAVHVYLQSNPATDGADRAELYLKSNRRTLQLITLPATTKDYLWVEGQDDTMRTFWPGIAGVDGNTHVLLFGGNAMSMGFRQPEANTTLEMRSYLTWPLAILNPAVGLLGGDLARSDLESMMYAAFACAQQLAGTDAFRYDVVPTGFSGPEDFLRAGTTCVLELVADPALATSTIEQTWRAAIGSAPRRTSSTNSERGCHDWSRRQRRSSARWLWQARSPRPGTACSTGSPNRLTLTLRGSQPRRSGTAATDLDGMWRRWQELNDTCRGGAPPGVDQAVDQSCDERDRLMRAHAEASSTAFLAAWRKRDATRMRQLSTPDAHDSVDRPLVDTLLTFSPAEDKFDLRYDVESTGTVTAYISTSEGGPTTTRRAGS